MKAIKKFLIAITCAITSCMLLFAFAACKDTKVENSSESSVEDSINSLTLNETSRTLGIGEEFTLTADKGNIDGEITWETANPSIATVIGGKVVAVGEGSTTITASVGNCTASCSVTVVAPTFSVSKSVLNMSIGDTETISVAMLENNVAVTSGITYTWSIINDAEQITVTPSEDTCSASIKANALGVATIRVFTTYKGMTFEKEIDVSIANDLYIGATQNSSFNLVKGGYEKELAYTYEVEGFEKTCGLTDFCVYDKNGVVDNATLVWESANNDIAVVEDGRITACGKGVTTVTGTYIDGKTGNQASVIITVRVDEMFVEKTFTIALGNNANADGLVLNFRDKANVEDVKDITVKDGNAVLVLLKNQQKEYEVTAEIFGTTVNFGDVVVGIENEYVLTTPDFVDTTALGSTNESFNASNMSIVFNGQGSSKIYRVQGQELTGEQWFGLEFKRDALDGVLSTFFYFNDGDMSVYAYLVSVPGQLAVRISTDENGWTEYKVNGESFGYPGIHNPYVFICRHESNHKVAYSIYQNRKPSLENAWGYTCETGMAYSADRQITTFGISSETSNYGTGVRFNNVYRADSAEKLLGYYVQDEEVVEPLNGKAFYISLGNNANMNGLKLTFTNQADVSDTCVATVKGGKAVLDIPEEKYGTVYAVAAEIFGAPVSFGTVTIGEAAEYFLAATNVHNNSNANALFDAEDMSLSYVGNASGSQFFVQGQAIKGEYWFGFKFKRNATTDGVLSTFMYLNESNIQTYIYFVSVQGQLAVRVSTSENNWTDYKVNGESFGFPGVDNPFVFVRRHNNNGKLAYTIYMNAMPTLEGAWSYTCTTGVNYSEDSTIGQFGFTAEADNYAEGVVFADIYSADSQEKLLKKYY